MIGRRGCGAGSSVGFVTMYLNDIQRSGFYAAIGLDARSMT